MPARRYRSKTYKQRFVHTPGGRTTVRYKGKRVRAARCASCGYPLGGVPRVSELRFLPHSSRMPNRPFGGYLCPSCVRQTIKEAARA